MIRIRVQPQNISLEARWGEQLLAVLRRAGLAPEAPCGGNGTCGKCTVLIDGQPVRACQVTVHAGLTVTIPQEAELKILSPKLPEPSPVSGSEMYAAVDIGTTSLVCCLLDGESGSIVATASAPNPQAPFGADVVSRIRAALTGEMEALTRLIRERVNQLLRQCCVLRGIAPDSIRRVCIVGNPAMQQLFLGISPENLVQIPFCPALRIAASQPCGDILPLCPDAQLLTVPDFSGYVGADTIGCIVASQMYKSREITLLVDIGTNGEMVLGNTQRLVACATAAGPALEGANIRFGMNARPGAIDHVWLVDGNIRFSTIDNGEPVGICGSGLIDAAAVFLELGKMNPRGRIAPGEEVNGERILRLTDHIYLTQEDIRQLQLAKGAIQAGIRLMMAHMGITAEEIHRVLLAGTFGTWLNPDNACRIGLLPPELRGKIESIGNAALDGACLMATDQDLFKRTEDLVMGTECLELASLPEFPKSYAAAMRF